MDLSKLKPGDKMEIRLLSQIEENIKTPEKILVFSSQLYDVRNDHVLEIAMPMQDGKMILFPVGTRVEATFISEGMLYRAPLTVTARKKENGLFWLETTMMDEVSKYQRRQFYRLEKMLDVTYYPVKSDVAEPEALQSSWWMGGDDAPDEIFSAVSLNISGGGMRLVTKRSLEKGQHVMLDFNLDMEEEMEKMHLLGEIVECRRIDGTAQPKYMVRLKFLSLSEGKREKIIKYIFNEERRFLREKG